ncbi:MAG: SusC/RagA family TonB-linked outer membrane protein [Paludibacteraceae bacterium]
MKYIISLILFALVPFCLSAQFNVKGLVTDDTGEGLLGATVLETGTQNGTTVDITGNFVLTVSSKNSKITVRYIGFKEKTLNVSASMNIVLENDENMLKEVSVVRVGFGSKSRITNAASVSQINAEQIRSLPSTSIQNSLAGRLPGLFQLQGSGQPGYDAATIFIRGMGTFADVETTPLILIDDVESDQTTLSRLSSNDIEEVSILKDAGSTSIFGIKGANGVILITTRRGKLGKPKLTFRSDFGFQQPTYKNEFLNSYQSLSLLKELHLNDNNATALAQERYFSDEALEHYRTGDSPYLYPDVNWYDLLYKKSSSQQQYTADVQGGTDAVKYFVSLAYLNQGGLFKDLPKSEDFNNDYYQKRYNVRANFDVKITKDFNARLNANAILTEINEPNLPSTRGTSQSIFQRLLGAGIAPYHYPAYNPNGTFGGYTGTYINPLALLTYGGYSRQFRNNVNGNITLDYDLHAITKGLKIKGVMALTNTWGFGRSLTRSEVLDYYYEPETSAYTPVITNQYILPLLGVSSSGYSPMVQINTRFDMAYNRKFGVHNVNGLVLANWYSVRTGSSNQRNSVSYSGRIGYDYDYRYIAELSAAYNGSDEFASNNRYDLFPAFTLGWNIAQEPYLKSLMDKLQIGTLKLRGSYGLSGSDKIAGNSYAYQESYGIVMNYYFGENPSKLNALGLRQYPNPEMRWETDVKTDVGIDLRMFSDRLSATVDYFYNKRKDILATRAGIVYYAGFLNVFADNGSGSASLITILPPSNIGRTENKGFDGELSWRDKITNNLNYFIRGTFSLARNKILYMDEAPSEYKLSMQTGRPIGTIFGYVADGFYDSWEEIENGPYDGLARDIAPGDLKYTDISGPNGAPDGIINEYDRVAIGNNIPDFTYGISAGITYKNFDFSLMFQGATGAKVSIESMLRLVDGTNSIVGSSNGKPMPIHTGRWTYYDADGNYVSDPETLIAMNKDASYPRLLPQNNKNSAQSTFWLRSADYLRWKNVEIGYNLPEKWIKSAGLTGARLYFTAQNLYTWSNLEEYQIDPESSQTGLTTYPQQKVFNVGCQISF